MNSFTRSFAVFCTSRAQHLFGLLAILVGTAGCNHAPPAPAKKPAEVVVTTPVEGDIADYQDFTGRLDGLKTVDIRAHVSGFIMEAPFKEGDLVREGDLLFQIDARPFQAALNQAEANLKVGQADQNLQARNVQRARVMAGSNSIAREDYDTMVAGDQKAKANVGALEAARDMARLNLVYTHVTAPLSGRISRRQVDPGNLINADNTVLTTIVSDGQLYAYFDVDERTYLDLVGGQNTSQDSWLANLEFPVLMSLANEGDKYQHVGKVNFIDNRVNATTGTIRMRAVFDNPRSVLKSGLFVRIRLPVGRPYKALLVGAEALQFDQGRAYVYVVDNKNQVVYRRVTVGQETHGLRVIKDGLAAGDHVIVSGMQRVRPGAPVETKTQPTPPPPESPLVKLLTANQPTQKAEAKDQRSESRGQKSEASTRQAEARKGTSHF